MTTITLLRTGLPPLRFEGELAEEASTQEHQGPLQNRWHELAIYRTAAGGWVAAVTFRTRWQGEHDLHWVQAAADDAGLIRALTGFDAAAGWHGHPPGSLDAERKNELLRRAIVGAYERALSALFGTLDLAEEI